MRTLLFLSLAVSLFADEFPKPFNSGTDVGKSPMSADEAVKLIKMPEGFRATVFAAEPDIQNPIACAWDSRGRLWIAENYTSAESAVGFDKNLRDRILIFEDTDNDGKADKRTVFADNLHNLSSIELGYGGVFCTAAPYLLWIPDADGDDKPDAPHKILLDGFDAGAVRHNFVNGLRWGPDGWLYARHGIQGSSRVAKPGTPDAERQLISVGIWRYHPVRHTVEMVTHGGTNPWGLDFNAEGEGFFTNTVTGHLYHMIPGAHYERMYGEDPNPFIYQLLPQTADHYHYDRAKSWTDSRDGKANDLGGGHAHVGCMIYQGENWPEQYRGKLMTVNLHGRCINVERLERKGSGYTAKHEPSVITFGDPWFRGNELTYGPDGGVYVLDWSDQGECHENDGVHRESGRIYKITYGEVKRPEWLVIEDLKTRDNATLARFAGFGSEWEFRVCGRLLAERIMAQGITEDEATQIQKQLRELSVLPTVGSKPRDRRMGYVKWILRGEKEGRFGETELTPMLTDYWTAYYLGKDSNVERAFNRWPQLLALGSMWSAPFITTEQGAPGEYERRLAEHQKQAAESEEAVLLTYWASFERIVSSEDASVSKRAVDIALACNRPLIVEFTARRLATDLATKPERLDGLLALANASFDEAKAASILRGISAAVRGMAKAKAPANWPAFAAQAGKIPALADKLRALNVIFGDGRALDEIRALALDAKAELASRKQAIESLIAAKPADLRATLESLVKNSNDLLPNALQGMAAFDDAGPLIAQNYTRVRPDFRPGVLTALCSRPAFATALLDAVAAGKIARNTVTPYHARQIAALADAAVSKRLAEVWGTVATTSDQKKKRMEELKAALTPEVLAKADIENGRTLYSQTCAACHTLFDLGQTGTNLGPNLTGSGRGDINYLLENIVDPSAIVPADYKLSIVTLNDGRLLTGFISKQDAQTLTLRTITETHTLDRTNISKTEAMPQSLMPEGILDALKPEQVRDLFGFLMRK